MKQTIQNSDVRDFMKRHLVEVFDTMLSLKAILAPKAKTVQYGERVAGSGGFVGEKVTGAIYLHLSLPMANHMAAAMVRLAPDETPDDSTVNDVVGEVTNMLTGGLKSWICDAGLKCVASTPTIIRGAGFSIEPLADVHRERLIFDCGDDRFSIEIHIKFN
jgi:CheY-specific phosphatase CheX